MKNKFSIGDTVWFMSNNEVKNNVVMGILKSHNDEYYYFLGKSFGWSDHLSNAVCEDELFATKKDLIKSL